MSSTTHHHSHEMDAENYQSLLMQYAAGCLDQAQTMVVQAHLSLSGQGHKILRDCACIGGTLLEKNCEPVAMSEASLNSVMQRLDAPANLPPQPETPAESILPEGHCLPDCIEKTVSAKSSDALKWKSFYPGIEFVSLPLPCKKSKAHIIKASPGSVAPKHAHGGLEITLLLDGSMYEEGERYTVGDLIIHDADTPPHSPQACEQQGCVCLTVSSAPMKFTGIASLLNPFVRF